MAKKENYLNNRDMLAEIHKSKSSYCEFIEPKYHNFDIILRDKEDIFNEECIEEAKKNKADRLTQQPYQRDLKLHKKQPDKYPKPKLANYRVKPDTITTEELVFRIITYEHIPRDPERKKNPKKTADHHVKLNFIPFKHYIIDDFENGTIKEVGRSHSKNGEFCMTHGAMTDKLAKMFMLLVNRYSQRSNWRGYCVDESTEALTQRGWLGIDNITENDNILSYDAGNLKWSKIKSIYRGDYEGLMHKITAQGLDMLITPEHKLVTKDGIRPIELLRESDRVVLLGDSVEGPTTRTYTDSLVELIGWIVTEGNYEYTPDKQSLKRICIWQNEGTNANRIRSCLNDLQYKFTEKTNQNGNVCFAVCRKDSRNILEHLPKKNLSMDLILSLTAEQRDLLIDTMIEGDGYYRGKNRSYSQKDLEHIEFFQMLCILSGYRSRIHFSEITSFGKPTYVHTMHMYSKRKNITNGERLDLHGGKRNGRDGQTQLGRGKINHPNVPTTQYKGRVWCPETEYGSFVARRNGTVYLTGNSYVSEMKGQALLQLSQMGLQFNEEKSDNPFSYFTAVISNSFTRVLNVEKRHQNTRDDLLEQQGKNPSFTRQLDHEKNIRKMREDAENDNQQ